MFTIDIECEYSGHNAAIQRKDQEFPVLANSTRFRGKLGSLGCPIGLLIECSILLFLQVFQHKG